MYGPRAIGCLVIYFVKKKNKTKTEQNRKEKEKKSKKRSPLPFGNSGTTQHCGDIKRQELQTQSGMQLFYRKLLAHTLWTACSICQKLCFRTS